MKKVEYIAIGLLTLLCFILMMVFDIKCPIKTIFDIDCAGCGGTRMIVSLLHLDFYQAFRFNPFLFILGIIFLIYIIYVLICILLKRKYVKINTKVLVTICVLVVVFMILRNIDGLEFLKPTIVK